MWLGSASHSSSVVMGRSPLVSHQKKGDDASCRDVVKTEGLVRVLSVECVWAAVLEPAVPRLTPTAKDYLWVHAVSPALGCGFLPLAPPRKQRTT